MIYYDICNPFDDIDFIVTYPVESGHSVEFEPVLRSSHAIKVGPWIGADFGVLRFRDLDNDGVFEAIIE